MKIGIIGASGQLGYDLVRAFESVAEIIRWASADFDITDEDKTNEVIKRLGADIIVNTAAFHKVEECEVNPEKSFAVNAMGAFNVAKAVSAVGAAVVFISTDYVFGNDKEAFDEFDNPNPLNVYGASKLAGEQLTKIANPNYYIIRTSALFGEHQSGKGHNFVTLMLQLAREGKEIKVVNDQFTSPTYTLDLAEKIKELILKKAPFGVYHIANSGSYSWYEFAKMIFETAKIKADLKPISVKDRPTNLTRPNSTVLMNEAITRAGLTPMRPLPEALKDYIDKIGTNVLYFI